MDRVRIADVSTAEGVAKAINQLIDLQNENEEYNEAVNIYNDDLVDSQKKGTVL